MHSAFLLLTLTCSAGEPIAAPVIAPAPIGVSSGGFSSCGCGGDVWSAGSGGWHRRLGGRLGLHRRRAVVADCGCASHDGPLPATMPPPVVSPPPPVVPGTASLPDAGYRPLPTAPVSSSMQPEPPLPVGQ